MSGHPKNSQSWSESEKEWFAEEHGTFQDADEWEGYNFSLSEAIEWARKIAVSCRCKQELREFQFDPES